MPVVITDAQMTSMCGEGGTFDLYIQELETLLGQITGSSGYPLLLTITAESLAAAQWSTGLVIDKFM